jgi:hypothetical protein
MPDKRMIALGGSPISFSCNNAHFHTNLNIGYPHGAFAKTPGSVLKTEPGNHGDYSIWLQLVSDKKESGRKLCWLMHYDKNGETTIPGSGVFEKSDLQNMIGSLAGFTP